MFLFLLILGLQARLKNGKRALADKWYVNEGDVDVTIPCEMDIGKFPPVRTSLSLSPTSSVPESHTWGRHPGPSN